MNPSRRPSVLVIEDDPAVRQTVADILELNDFVGLVASDGVEGLTVARQEQPTVIVTDIEMPGMTGYQLLKELRKDEGLRATPVIVITAKADRAAGRQAMDLGADDYITKPFTEDELIRSIKTRLERKELIDELDAFAHTVAHDLRNPLATLVGRLGLLDLQIGKADPAVLRHSVDEASSAATRLNAIIEELLLLTGVRRQHVLPQVIEMGPIVTEARASLENLLTRSGASIEAPADWPLALGHGPWVKHVWINFISNAATYGGPQAEIRLGAKVDAMRRVVRFWVQDKGPGIEPAVQAKLFVPFGGISTVRAKGHGLGLSIVRRIMEKLGGAAGVESSPGAGARFWFELPLAPT